MKYNRTKLVLPLPVPLGASNISNHVIFPANNSSVTVIHLDKDRAIRCPLNVTGANGTDTVKPSFLIVKELPGAEK